jgi:IMP cyclohydrolase
MYVGRFVVVGPTVGAYRVSSRSFPNRQAVRRDDTVTVEPTPDAPETDNPYISYNGVRLTDRGAVVGNGSHVDPIAEKLALGYPARDALAEPLLSLDFEKDDYDTPRIAGIVGVDAADPTTRAEGPGAVIGTVRRDAVIVEEVTEPTLVATYEEDSPTAFDLAAETADDAAREVYDHEFEHAVCSAGVAGEAGAFDLSVYNGA